MLTGKELGLAIKQAIDLKIAAGSISSKAQIASYFGIKPPAIYDWIKKGSISKDKIPKLCLYFSDVVTPQHWGLSAYPVDATNCQDVPSATNFSQPINYVEQNRPPPYEYGNNIAKIIASTFDEHNNALVKGEITVSAIAYSAAIRILSEGGLGKPVAAQMICASDEECELLEIYRKTKSSGQKSILDAAKGIQMGLPIANNIEMFPIKIPMRLKTT